MQPGRRSRAPSRSGRAIRGPKGSGKVKAGGHDAGIGRSRPQDRQGRLRARRAEAARGADHRSIRDEPRATRADPGPHQRPRRRRPRRNREQAQRVDGSAVHPHPRIRRRRARRKGPAARVALLAGAAAPRQDRHLHERVVPPADRRTRAAGRESCAVQRVSAGHTAARADARRRGHRAAQVLDPLVARRPEAAIAGTRVRPENALARDRHRQAGVQVLQQVPRRLGGDAARNVDRRRAVVRRRRRRSQLSQLDGGEDPAGRHGQDRRASEARAASRGGARALGARERRADPPPRPYAKAQQGDVRTRSLRNGRRSSSGSRVARTFATIRSPSPSRDRTPPARAAPSGAWRRRSMRGNT